MAGPPPKKHLPILIKGLEGDYMIAPSIIAGGNKESFESKIEVVEKFGCDVIHLDVMDGKFVPNITFFHDTIKKLRGITKLPFDAHLMVHNPHAVLDSYIDAGCDIITVHVEACKDETDFEKINNKIISSGVSPGMAINPNTELPEWVYRYLDCLDVIIIMSVNPGFAGQKFIPSVLDKMKYMIPRLRENGYGGYFEADGGIDLSTISACYESGCRIFVMGNAIFGSDDVIGTIKNTKYLLDSTLEKELLLESASIGIKEDWIKNRKSILNRYSVVKELWEEK